MVGMASKHCFIWIWNVWARAVKPCQTKLHTNNDCSELVSQLIGRNDRFCALLPFVDEIKFVLFFSSLSCVIWYNMIQFKRHHNQKIRITLAKIWLKQFRFCPFPICQTKSIKIISHALLNRCVRLCYLNAVLCKYVSNWFGNRIYLSLCADNNSTTFDIQRFAHHETRNTIPACWPLKDGVY